MREHAAFEAHSSYVLDLLFTGDSRTLVSAGMDNVVKLWSVPNWELTSSLEGHEHSVNSIALSPDERVLASGSGDNTVRLWSFPGGELLRTLQNRKQVVSAVAISPDESKGALSLAGRVQVWDVLKWEMEKELEVGPKSIGGLAFSPDGRWLVVGAADRKIRIYEME